MGKNKACDHHGNPHRGTVRPSKSRKHRSNHGSTMIVATGAWTSPWKSTWEYLCFRGSLIEVSWQSPWGQGFPHGSTSAAPRTSPSKHHRRTTEEPRKHHGSITGGSWKRRKSYEKSHGSAMEHHRSTTEALRMSPWKHHENPR